jgi:hypothetical protein
MKLHTPSSLARALTASGLLLAAFAVQAQMQTPPPNVPPSARPVERPTKPIPPPRAASSSPQADLPAAGTTGTVAPGQSPTQLGQAQVNIPFGKGEESQKPGLAGPASVAAPPAVAASRAKARPARKASGNELRRER